MKYEKPVSIDMGRVAPILGNNCSDGSGAEGYCATGESPESGDCSVGFSNSTMHFCQIGGGDIMMCGTGNLASADNYGCIAGNSVGDAST